MGSPMRTARSSSGASDTGSRMPATANQCPPSQTCTRPPAWSMPSALAALAPSTAAGNRAVAWLRKAPRARCPCTVRNRLVVAE